jgi:metal-responsive CopG/Arc/MetJ family transcriptional regulator
VTLTIERPYDVAPVERRSRQERLTVSLPAELVEFVRARSEKTQEPQSAIVADALRRVAREERNRRIMRELISDSEEEVALAEEGLAISAPATD